MSTDGWISNLVDIFFTYVEECNIYNLAGEMFGRHFINSDCSRSGMCTGRPVCIHCAVCARLTFLHYILSNKLRKHKVIYQLGLIHSLIQ